MLPECQSAVIIVTGYERTDEEIGSEIRRKHPHTYSAVHLNQTHADSPVLRYHKMTSPPFPVTGTAECGAEQMPWQPSKLRRL